MKASEVPLHWMFDKELDETRDRLPETALLHPKLLSPVLDTQFFLW